MKLDHGLVTTVGEPGSPAVDAALSTLPAFSQVTAGAVTVNGVDIAVDPATTTIRDFISRVDALAGVSASVDGASVRISAERASDPLSVSGDTSGLWAALGGSLGTADMPSAPRRLMRVASANEVTSNGAQVATALARAIDTLNLAIDLTNPDDGETAVRRPRLENALDSAIGALAARGLDGISGAKDGGAFKIRVDTAKLTESLTANADGIAAAADAIAGLAKSSFADIGSGVADFVASSAVNVPADRSAANLLADQVKAKFLATRLTSG
jgi:hypothetical protein